MKKKIQGIIDREIQGKQFPSEEPPEKKTEIIACYQISNKHQPSKI